MPHAETSKPEVAQRRGGEMYLRGEGAFSLICEGTVREEIRQQYRLPLTPKTPVIGPPPQCDLCPHEHPFSQRLRRSKLRSPTKHHGAPEEDQEVGRVHQLAPCSRHEVGQVHPGVQEHAQDPQVGEEQARHHLQ